MISNAGLDIAMDVVAWTWHVILSFLRWLFADDCKTSAPLLSLSFAINSTFTGLALSRFNMCEWMKRKALKCIDDSVGDKFLANVERLGKDNNDIQRQLIDYQKNVTQYRTAMQNGSATWEWVRRITTSACAFTAFMLLAFEANTRIGVALVLPYLLLLFGHALWVWIRTRRVSKSFKVLATAMDNAAQSNHPAFDLNDCVKKLKAEHKALSPKPIKATQQRPRKKK